MDKELGKARADAQEDANLYGEDVPIYHTGRRYTSVAACVMSVERMQQERPGWQIVEWVKPEQKGGQDIDTATGTH